ncbi:CHAD domain-containing protein [Gordonia iterans]|uniref:CHAD domain-containing protein n=1 Tax=Gordonia iterans TaxID=1004901 RepID=A0A2S0KH97_9ACTN|nr:CYTH and CHAD domain-containing protein [Gordonia iterans]AVM01068.1 CHAD domain-containing protein [Gordonia iterans]
MSARESIEVELKFDVDAGQPAPPLASLVPDGRVGDPHRYELVATYLDTPTHDLAARKITLRRRTGGTDAGWHLKRPAAGTGARRELAVSFDDVPPDGSIPPEIRAAILAIVRNRPLIPVAEITNERTVTVLYDAEGASVAEFCSDRVLSHAHQSHVTKEWAEWEFELTGGDAKLLKPAARLLRGSGARSASSISKLARAIGTEPHVHAPNKLPKRPTGLDLVLYSLATHRDSLIEWDPAVRVNAYDAVHQMRVTARKLRSVLTSFPDVLDPDVTGTLGAELSALGEVLGEARDCEVQLEINAGLLERESDPPADLRAALIDDQLARQERALKSVRFALSTQRYLKLLDDLDDLIANPRPGPDAERSAEKVALAGIEHARKRIRKAERRLDDFEPWTDEWVEQVHRIRKRAKAVRYTADAAKPLRLKDAVKAAAKAAAIQTHLGDFNDTAVNREKLAQIATKPGLSPHALFVLGRLDAREELRGREAVQAYLDAR